MHFERVIVAYLTFIFPGFVTSTIPNIKRNTNVIVPVNQEVTGVALRYTNGLIRQQQTLGGNFRVEFLEMIRGANETLNVLRRGADEIRKGQLNEATPQEAEKVMPLREKYSQMIQEAAQLLMVDDKMIATPSVGFKVIREVIENLKEQKKASETFGGVVVSKMPSWSRGRLNKLDNEAHFALQNAIELWKSRETKCRDGSVSPLDSIWCDLDIFGDWKRL